MTRLPTRAVTPAGLMSFATPIAAMLAMALTANLFLAGCMSDGGGASVPTQPGKGTGISCLGKGPAPVPLGKAGGYVILAKTGISTTGTTAVTGNIEVSPAAVEMGTTSHFEGVVLSQTSVTLKAGATMNGRALAQTAVILDANTLVEPAL